MERGPWPFRLVDFDIPDTWRHVPMHEWLRTREEIHEKLRIQTEGGGSDQYMAVREEAFRQFAADEAKHNRRLESSLSDRQVRRIQQLTKEGLDAIGMEMPRLTPWETQFSRKTTWLDRVASAFDGKSDDDKLICMLFLWCSHSDRRLEGALRTIRSKSKADASIRVRPRLNHGKIPCLPEPIELLQIRRLADLLVEHLVLGATIAEELQLRADESGAAFECQECSTMHETINSAEHCCGRRYDVDKRKLLEKAIPPYSIMHHRSVSKFVDLLWRYGYDIACSDVDAGNWEGWQDSLTTPPGALALRFLEKLFDANTKTIMRRLTRSRLQSEYTRFNVEPRFRHFQIRSRRNRVEAHLRPQGWYREDYVQLPFANPSANGIHIRKW